MNIVDVAFDGAEMVLLNEDGTLTRQSTPTAINANYVCQFFNLKDGAAGNINGRRELTFAVPGGVTADDINKLSFGATYQVKGGPAFALVDELSLSVQYAVPGGGNDDDDPPNPLGNTIGDAFLGVAVNNQGRIVAVGDAGRIFVGSIADVRQGNPLSEASIEGMSVTITDVVWARDRFFAVGFGGVALMSTDGNTWTRITSGTKEDLMSICYSPAARKAFAVGYGNARFVARLL